MKQLGIPGIAGHLVGELIIDLFAGAGGASHGIEQALGRSPDIAVNHDPASIEMHAQNHPATDHLCESIYDVSPRAVTGGQAVGLLWASPSCTHFSRARGGTPVSRQERGLGWQIVKWAALTRPRVIICENVAEWQTWGPVRRGKPVKRHSGKYFQQLLDQLRSLGYNVEHRVLNAADHGAPTTRKRLFLVARCDGVAITWPDPTHGPNRKRPYRTAAECIDWSDLGNSIFERSKPLAAATCRRIAAGVVRYVLQGKPFLVVCNHSGDHFRGQSIDEPMCTLTASRDAHGLVTGAVIEIDNQSNRVGERNLGEPLTTITHKNRHALVAAFLAKHYTGVVGQACDQPLGTVTAVDHHSLVACHLTKFRQNAVGSSCSDPVPTITSGAGSRRPAGAAHALGLVAAHLVTMRGTQPGHIHGDDLTQPLRTISAGGSHHALCAAFLTTYYSGGGTASRADDPVPTIVTKARHGLVLVEIDGSTYALADIRLRMLQPAELARAQGFPSSYILSGTKAQQIGRIGNSVCPPIAQAIVASQFATEIAVRAIA